MQKIQNLTYITFLGIFSEKQWNMVFMYVIRWRFWRWFQKWLQISCGTNGSLDNPFLEQIFRNSLKFPIFNTNFGLEREPFVPHEIWSHIWNQREIPERNRYMKTIFHCFSEKIQKNVIYSLRSDLIFTFGRDPLRQIANKLGIGQSKCAN